MTGLHDKKYYNVIINGNPPPDSYYSPAKFNIHLNDSVLKDASKYSLIVQKFKIDSESIPLFHVELVQPQPKVEGNIGFITKYVVYVNISGVVYSSNLLYNKPNGKPAPITKDNGDGTVYYDNTDNVFSIYSYNDFIGMINTAINDCMNQASSTLFNGNPIPIAELEAFLICPFFEYDPLSERIKYWSPDGWNNTLYFSRNLHPFIGEGFSTTYYWNNPFGINQKVWSINVYQFTYNYQEYNSNTYWVMTQEHKAISSWANINRVLFVSNNLPIVREFFPINDTKGLLVDNITESYRKMSNMPIITSFLINSSDAGDYRTSIIFSTSEVDNSDIITMPTNTEIRIIDIEVYWSDKFGNVYPLVLAEGKQIDVRLAFIEK